MSVVGRIHERAVYRRRLDVLASLIAERLPKSGRVLDVGCGDGRLAATILTRRPGLELRGVDVLARDAAIPVDLYDGVELPYDEDAFDVVTVVDVLHHTDDPQRMMREMKRVARVGIVIKDHLLNGVAAGPRLRFMDWVGNAPHGVRLPYNYWPRDRWHTAFDALDLEVHAWTEDVPLYPVPLSWVFGASLHFVTELRVEPPPSRVSVGG